MWSLAMRSNKKMGPTRLAAFAKEHLGATICGKSGQVLYSGVETLRPGDLYLLGHNPGDPSKNTRRLMTVGRSLDGLPTNNRNSYLDTVWAGRDTLQRRVIWLITSLGFHPRRVAASNLLFVRSRDAGSSKFHEYADLCWSIHEEILKIVKPRLIVVYGNSTESPYSFLKAKYEWQTEQRRRSGHGGWTCRSFVVRGRFRVVGLPHLSRYDVTRHYDVVQWIKGLPPA